jgi:kumamolisin
MNTMNQALATAGALGMTVFCAAGDQGSTDGVTDGKNHVDFPGSSPYATSCGGTRLESQNGKVTSEEVWNENPTSSATGGGISAMFALPAWQANANVPPPSENGGKPKRGVPDVAADADPETGYRVRVDGVDLVFGGTSAVASLWAGLTALLNQHRRAQDKQTVGYLNPALYQNYQALRQANALRDVFVGNNGAFVAKLGWDACTGVGTPVGSNLATALP